jgi:hypothetical protein
MQKIAYNGISVSIAGALVEPPGIALRGHTSSAVFSPLKSAAEGQE